ncbi:hypothetical protein Tcan_00517, partial [Toxocara canis]
MASLAKRFVVHGLRNLVVAVFYSFIFISNACLRYFVCFFHLFFYQIRHIRLFTFSKLVQKLNVICEEYHFPVRLNFTYARKQAAKNELAEVCIFLSICPYFIVFLKVITISTR